MLLTFSCKTRGFCHSYHTPRLGEAGRVDAAGASSGCSMDYLDFIARVTSHIPKGWAAMIRKVDNGPDRLSPSQADLCRGEASSAKSFFNRRFPAGFIQALRRTTKLYEEMTCPHDTMISVVDKEDLARVLTFSCLSRSFCRRIKAEVRPCLTRFP